MMDWTDQLPAQTYFKEAKESLEYSSYQIINIAVRVFPKELTQLSWMTFEGIIKKKRGNINI